MFCTTDDCGEFKGVTFGVSIVVVLATGPPCGEDSLPRGTLGIFSTEVVDWKKEKM